MKSTLMLLVLLAAALLFAWGCERNVTNETDNDFQSSGCFGCHNDVDGRLQKAEGEWNNSTHASGLSIDYTNRGGGSDCVRCHDHQGFVEFQTTGEIHPPYENVSAIHCFTCHAPHTTGTLELRADDPVALKSATATFDAGNGNLCANCHQARSGFGSVTLPYALNARFGPHHSNQSDMLRGVGGYHYAGYTYPTDGHYAAVPDGCIGCHMGDPRIHAGYDLGGHSFNMREHEDTSVTMAPQCTPCHDAITTTFDENLDNVDYDGDAVVEGYQTELHGLLEELKTEMIAAGLWDGEDDEITRDTVASADTLGALWNFVYVEEDQSKGMHNWDYTVALIQSSINYLRTGNPNGTPGVPSRKLALSSH